MPIPDDEEEFRPRRRPRITESVDQRLRDLTDELKTYRLNLERQMTDLYRNFQKQVLLVTLYNKDFDTYDLDSPPDVPSEEQRTKLTNAFASAGLIDQASEQRIKEHFGATSRALQSLTKQKEGGVGILMRDVFAVPLSHRTNKMILYSEQLEEASETLFTPLRTFETIASEFLHPKTVAVLQTGNLIVEDAHPGVTKLTYHQLSSGEKQMLILLIQALVSADRPAVYVVDEPELSLHVKWQNKLLHSLAALGGQIQLIVATHSPDIVGPYHEKIVYLDK